MRLKGGNGTVFVLLLFILNTTFICGEDDDVSNLSGSVHEVGEEVSIEAVDDEDLRPSLFASFSGTESSTESPIESSSGSGSDQPSDDSTAVATVYPDIGGNGVILGNTSSLEGGTNTTNATTTSRYLRVKVMCSELYPALSEDQATNSSLNETGTVEIVNMTYLLHGVLVTNPAIKTRTMPSNCTIVLFFTHWCPWSAKAAPHFNALPRAFRNIRFAAIDSSVHTAINTYFGILSVPSVVLFYNGKILAKFNETTFNVNYFADFISTFTDQKPGIRLNVTSVDFIGPVPSTVTKGPDWYLYISWVFIVIVFIYYMTKTAFWHRLLELIHNSWREAEAVSNASASASDQPPHHHHFHQD